MKLYCIVLAGAVSSCWGVAAWAACPAGKKTVASGGCAPAVIVGLVPGPALEEALHDVSFATASAADFERLLLQGPDQPVPLAPLAHRDTLPAPGALPDAPSANGLVQELRSAQSDAAVRSAEAVAAAQGSQVTASAVPEPDALVMMLTGLAAVLVLFTRRARWDR